MKLFGVITLCRSVATAAMLTWLSNNGYFDTYAHNNGYFEAEDRNKGYLDKMVAALCVECYNSAYKYWYGTCISCF